MFLPAYVKNCIDALEQAGFAAYAVGGCVRDALLGLDPADYDLCTAALPEQTEEVFRDHKLVLAGKKHGTVGVVTEGGVVEITTFRTEGAYLDNRHPEWVAFVPEIEADLARRDFTVNAMAYSPSRGFADPFGGRDDLKAGILRAVGDPAQRFREDSLRILRGARFAAKYRLTPDPATEMVMFSLASLMDNLARERVFDELCKLLLSATAADLTRFAPVITAAIPELAPAVGFDQRNPHHSHDVYGHIARVVEGVPKELPLRWAALLHDAGKPACFTLTETGRGRFLGHAKVGAQIANDVLLRLKAPTQLREDVVFLVERHMVLLEPDKKLLRRRLSQYGVEHTQRLLALQRADFGGKGTGDADDHYYLQSISGMLNELLAERSCLTLKGLAIDGRDLMAIGYAPGKALGNCLQHLLELVLDEQLPNEKEALLQEAEYFKL
ncbi:MAG: CCA tRNA nucleotidyltransferase [Oscillospiraceae bacterium]|nr:CCA tRNA nucleotidyltransferase [Oscillospiraceae bacterium]